MDMLLGLFALVLLAGLIAPIPIGLGWTRRWGLAGAKDAIMVGVASFIGLIVVGAFAGPSENRTTPAKTETTGTRVATPVKQRPSLDKIRIEHVLWEKSGFGSVMIATFRIDNDNEVRIKDVRVTCRHFTNSGSQIDSNTRTIYELIEPRSYHYVRDMNMGFIHSAATRTECKATNFVG